jgi:hypothetical protein
MISRVACLTTKLKPMPCESWSSVKFIWAVRINGKRIAVYHGLLLVIDSTMVAMVRFFLAVFLFWYRFSPLRGCLLVAGLLSYALYWLGVSLGARCTLAALASYHGSFAHGMHASRSFFACSFGVSVLHILGGWKLSSLALLTLYVLVVFCCSYFKCLAGSFVAFWLGIRFVLLALAARAWLDLKSCHANRNAPYWKV